MLTLLLVSLLTQPPPPPETLVDPDRVMANLAALPTSRAARGDIASQQGLIATEDLIIARLKEMGYTPTLEDLSWNLNKQAAMEEKLRKETRPKPDSKPDQPEPGAQAPLQPTPPSVDTRMAPETTPDLASHTWHNIIVEFPGRDLPKEMLIVGAHFDAVPGAPGADDNGTGVAALLEAARVLKDRPMRRSVRLIFFNLEELGLYGSKDYVRRIRKRVQNGDEKIVGMVSLEMLGFFSDAPNSQRTPIPRIEGVFEPPTVGDFIGIATIRDFQSFCRAWAGAMKHASPDLKIVYADMFPFAPPDFLRSDHAPFLLSGMPALMLTDTSNFRNPNYHKPTDTLATIDKTRFVQVVRGVAGAIDTLANAPDAPAPPPSPDK